MLWNMVQKIVRHVAQCGARTRFAPLSYSDDMVNSSGGDCRGERGKERILYDIRREKFNAVKSFGLANPEQADAKVEPFRVEWTWPQSRCEASECVLLGHTSSLLCRRPTEVLDLIVGSPGKCEPRLGGCTLLPHTWGRGGFNRSDQIRMGHLATIHRTRPASSVSGSVGNGVAAMASMGHFAAGYLVIFRV